MSFPELSPLFSSTGTNLGGGGLKIYFFEFPHPLEFFIFLYFSYPWKIQAQQSSTPEYSTKLWETPGNSTCYFFDPRKFHILNHRSSYLDFFPISPLAAWKFHFLKLTAPVPCLAFFWNSPSKVKNQDLRNFAALSLMSSLEIPCQCPQTHRPQLSVWVFSGYLQIRQSGLFWWIWQIRRKSVA